MRTPITSLHVAIIAMLSLAGTQLHAGAPERAPRTDAVNLTAWLHVEDLTMADVVVELRVGGTVHTGRVTENGRIDLSLPADVEAVLRFTKPGHLPKEVVVDTRHMNDGDFDGKTRHVSFAVILEPVRHMKGFVYPGPVGNIGFEEGGGCLAVQHDTRKIQTVERQTMVVF